MSYDLHIIDKIYVNEVLYGVVTKTLSIPFLPFHGLTVVKDNIKIHFDYRNFFFDLDKNVLKYEHYSVMKSIEEAESYINTLLTKSTGYTFEKTGEK